MRGVIAAAQQVGQVHDSVRLGVQDRGDHILELHDVAAHNLHLSTKLAEVRRSRVDVHHDYFLAALDQPGNRPLSNKPGAAQNQCRHR